MMALEACVTHRGWTQAAAGRRLCVTQPRVLDLMRGRIALFGLDPLVNLVVAAGSQVALRRMLPADRTANRGDLAPPTPLPPWWPQSRRARAGQRREAGRNGRGRGASPALVVASENRSAGTDPVAVAVVTGLPSSERTVHPCGLRAGSSG